MGDSYAVEINEEIKGFADVIAALPQNLPGIDPDWFPKMVLPAFETELHGTVESMR